MQESLFRSGTARAALVGGLAVLALIAAPLVALPASAATAVSCDDDGAVSAGVLTVADGETCTVSATTTLDRLVLVGSAALVAPDGYDVTLTVDGVETGQDWDSITDVAGTLQPGTYQGAGDGGVVLTVTTRHAELGSSLTFPVRQSLFVDASGVDRSQSVPDSWLGGKPGAARANDLQITSTGSTFNGVWVDGTTYRLNDPVISLTGDGRNDFVADGAAITGTNGANLTVDGAQVDDAGVVRTGVVADGGANVVVKNSTINAAGGELPDDYTINVAFDTMVAAPWMLGLEGTNRATLLMGDDTKASYVDSTISAEDWGALSTDSGSGVELTAINSTVEAVESGYGSYLIGAASGDYLGTTFDVADYGIITANGANTVNLGASDAASVAGLNTSRSIGLSGSELAALDEQQTTIRSGRIGVMTWAGNSTVNVTDDTVIDAGQAVFEDKTSTSNNKVVATYNVTGDATSSPSLHSDEGTILQVMSNDDPFPQSSYTDKTAVADGYDLDSTTVASRTDVNLTGTTVKGNFYNGAIYDKNLVLTLDDSTVRGVISSSTALHTGTVDPEHYANIGTVANTVGAPVNNGVIVDLTGDSTWRVTGTSYLTSLTVGEDASLVGVGGKAVTVTIGGTTYDAADLVAGTTYTGDGTQPIVVSVADGDIASTTTVAVADTAHGHAGTAKVAVVDADGTAAEGSVTVALDGTTIGTATLEDGAASVTLPSGTASGSHRVTATYAGDGEGVAGSTASTTYRVAAVSSTSVLKLGTKRVAAGKRVTAKLVVRAAQTPTGKVRVMNGSTVVATFALPASAHGKLTKKLRFAKPGLYKLRVVYGGSDAVAASRSTVVRLRVTR